MTSDTDMFNPERARESGHAPNTPYAAKAELNSLRAELQLHRRLRDGDVAIHLNYLNIINKLQAELERVREASLAKSVEIRTYLEELQETRRLLGETGNILALLTRAFLRGVTLRASGGSGNFVGHTQMWESYSWYLYCWTSKKVWGGDRWREPDGPKMYPTVPAALAALPKALDALEQEQGDGD